MRVMTSKDGWSVMREINNSGAGNCMYYAYSISLMYYLRAQSNQDNANALFDTLDLSDPDRQQLSLILKQNNKLDTPYLVKDTKMIERILGPACRNLAGLSVQKEFETSAQDTQLFTVAAFRLTQEIKKNIQKKLHKDRIILHK